MCACVCVCVCVCWTHVYVHLYYSVCCVAMNPKRILLVYHNGKHCILCDPHFQYSTVSPCLSPVGECYQCTALYGRVLPMYCTVWESATNVLHCMGECYQCTALYGRVLPMYCTVWESATNVLHCMGECYQCTALYGRVLPMYCTVVCPHFRNVAIENLFRNLSTGQCF